MLHKLQRLTQARPMTHFLDKYLAAAGAMVIMTGVTGMAGCSSAADKEKEDLKRELSDAKAQTSSLQSQLTLMQNSNEQKKKQLESGSGTATTIDTTILNTKANSAADPNSAATNTSTSANTNTVQFTDLADVPDKELIEQLAQLHVFDDLAPTFKPYQPITRGEYITWLYRAYNAIVPKDKQLRLAPQSTQQFKDTPESNAAYKYVQALSNAGYSIGYKDGTFKPDKPITREEMIGIKVGLDVGKDLPPYRSQMEYIWKFSDAKDVDERFTGYVQQDYYTSGPHGSNIQRAFGKIGKFKPKQPVLRYEAAGTLWQQGQFGNNGGITAADTKNKSN